MKISRFTVASFLVLAGCASTPNVSPLPRRQTVVLVSRCPEVHVGMTFDQVTALLGEPLKKESEIATPGGGPTFQMYEYFGANRVMYSDGKVNMTTCSQAPQTYDRPR